MPLILLYYFFGFIPEFLSNSIFIVDDFGYKYGFILSFAVAFIDFLLKTNPF
jgi:hypothetical protein